EVQHDASAAVGCKLTIPRNSGNPYHPELFCEGPYVRLNCPCCHREVYSRRLLRSGLTVVGSLRLRCAQRREELRPRRCLSHSASASGIPPGPWLFHAARAILRECA